MNSGIKSYPAGERPYERCEEYGAEALSDAELLAVILRSGKKGLDAKIIRMGNLMSRYEDGEFQIFC